MVTICLLLLFYLDTKFRQDVGGKAMIITLILDIIIFSAIVEIAKPSCDSIRGAIESRGECECK